MLIEIRKATPSDLDWLMTRLLRLSEFAGTKTLLFEDNDYSRAGLLNLIDKHVMFIAVRECQAVGFIGGYFVPHPFNPKVTMLSELFWWVDEDQRRTSAGGKLLNSFLEYGKAHADWIVFGLNTHTPVKEDTILKLGFTLHERCYLLETK